MLAFSQLLLVSLRLFFHFSLYHCRGFSDTCWALDLNDNCVQHELERQERGMSASSVPNPPFSAPFYVMLPWQALWFTLTTGNNGDEWREDALGRWWLFLLTGCPASASAARSLASAQPLLRNPPKCVGAYTKCTDTLAFFSLSSSTVAELPPFRASRLWRPQWVPVISALEATRMTVLDSCPQALHCVIGPLCLW